MQAKYVRLRPLRKEDSKLLYQWITDRDLFILNAPYKPVSEMEHEKWVESMLLERSDLVLFVIEDLASSLAIGTCQLLNVNARHRSAELQIRIGDESARGKGLGTEAVKLLLNFGFRDLNLHRIYLHVFKANKRAARAYEKCGFHHEGLLRQAAFIDGGWKDVNVMGILKTDEE